MNGVALEGFPLEVLSKVPMTMRDKLAYLTKEFLKLPQVECPLRHYFAPGVYVRELFMPAGTLVIGKIHRTEHLNILEKGACFLLDSTGKAEEVCGPYTFVSGVGVQKMFFIVEDVTFKTIHPTEETDLEKLEELLIEPYVPDLLAVDTKEIL